MKLFSGSANKPLALRVAKALGIEVAPVEIFVFPDGERRVQVQVSVLEEDTVVIQPTSTPVDQNYMELFLLIDALKRSGARSITVVIPYLGYQRQDHVFRDGEAVSVQVIIKHLESQLTNLDKVITFDLHTPRISDLFSIPNQDLSAIPLFAKNIIASGIDLTNAVLISPDMGGIRRIKMLSEQLYNMHYGAVVKNRDLATGNLEDTDIEWMTDRKSGFTTAFIVDDMISSGGTMVKAAEILKKQGIHELYAFATHAVFSQDAPQLLQKSSIKNVVVTDSLQVADDRKFSKLEVLSIADEIAETLKNR